MPLNLGRQVVQAGKVFVTSVIAAGELELPFEDEEDQHETLAEQPTVDVTPSVRRNKRKEAAPAQDNVVQSETSVESPPSPPTKSKRLRKKAVVEYVATEEPAAAPTTTSGTDEELREAFEAVEQEKEVDASIGDEEKTKEVEKDIISGTLAVMPIHSLPSSSTTASFVDPELAKSEAMDLDAQLDRLEKLSSTPGKAKSKAVDEAVDRVKIWLSAELDLDDS
ncbi:unnamed protein product, partial [Prunus brigantina]